jgi:predicted outer membrane lipoprotein
MMNTKKPSELQDSGNIRQFESGAIRDNNEGKGRCDLLPACALLRLSKHYETGGKKYGDNNWQKGMPISVLMDSSARHLLKYLDGWTDEDHLAAAAWNILNAMWMEEKRPDMQDLETRKKVEEGEWVKC